ncbi:histidine phosphatase family protein [Kineococcus rubinsiae]|uniref:histidine phosphatase family protein n=1 Tax=Kineococcus rubinsiae TaxID=2609562 RepID=UPI0014310007|nr:histidine phosphatase family protein [Kineococcus rubinsiae]NIZ89432.1 histidine phosphatase family protein [Kineococcus rubinsiae]
MRLFLVRHGQSPSNVRHLLDTAVPGPSLTDLGREQADAVAALLADEGIGLVAASSQARAQETARPLASALGLDVRVLDGLREIAAGENEMRGDDEAVAAYLGVVASWLHGDLDVAQPGAEDGHAFLARYDAGVADAVAQARAAGVEALAVVSHGAAIRTWTGVRVANLTADFVIAHGLENTGCVALEGSPEDGWRALTWMGAVVDADEARATGTGPAGEPADTVPGSVF